MKLMLCILLTQGLLIGICLSAKRRGKSSSKDSSDISDEFDDKFSKEDLKELQQKIQAMIAADNNLIPPWVQMGFHDCFGADGCNGCLDFTHPGNKGLITTFNNAKMLHKDIGKKLSLADFIALLAIEAAKAGASSSRNFVEGSINIPFSKGRKTCTRKIKDRGLPSGFQTDGIKILKQQFGLSTKEAVALLGCHSLGRAHTQFSGFEGPWDRTPLVLDNGYYFALSRPSTWVPQFKEAAKSHQWITMTPNGPGENMMLHVDMAMRKKFKISKHNKDFPSCTTMDECKDNTDTLPFVIEFADSQETFHRVFSTSYLKMVNKSRAKLKLLE